MKWIGLTGGIASGKSTVSKKLKEHGYPVIDADEVARKVVEVGSAGLKSIIHEFGVDFLQPDGSLDRQKLASLVFHDETSKRRLESILHPLIKLEVHQIKSELEKKGVRMAIYDMPLLFEVGAHSEFDSIVVVDCSEDQQKQRLMNRSLKNETPINSKEVDLRIASQWPLEKKAAQADFVVHNDQDEQKLNDEVIRLLKWLESI